MKPSIVLLALSFSLLACQKKVTQQAQPPSLDSSSTQSPTQPEPYRAEQPLPEADTISNAVLPLRVFLDKGELMLFDSLTQQTHQLTLTDQSIDEFLVSPTSDYVVCLKRIGMIPDPELEANENAREVPVHVVLVLETSTLKIIREFNPPDDFVDVTKWVSKSRFHLWTSDGFAVGESFVYDAFRDSLQQLTLKWNPRVH